MECLCIQGEFGPAVGYSGFRGPVYEGVAQVVVSTLLWVAAMDGTIPHITVDVWSWVTKQPSLPFPCEGRFHGSRRCIVKVVRELEDIEILKSYLFFVWSEGNSLRDDGFDEKMNAKASSRKSYPMVILPHM